MAGPAKAEPKVPCEFCGAMMTAPLALLTERVACDDCRRRVKWCPCCGGAACADCSWAGLDLKADDCQKTGAAYCEPEVGCESCRLRLIERHAEASEARADHAREIGWAR